MKFRPATLEDAKLLLWWRNDSETRRWSRNTEALDSADFVTWLSDRITSGHPPLIAETDGWQIGTIRLDKRDDGTELSWTIAPEHRRKGYGRRMVEAALQLADGPILAEIKPGNIASLRIVQAIGFTLRSEQRGLQCWVRNSIIVHVAGNPACDHDWIQSPDSARHETLCLRCGRLEEHTSPKATPVVPQKVWDREVFMMTAP